MQSQLFANKILSLILKNLAHAWSLIIFKLVEMDVEADSVRVQKRTVSHFKGLE